MALPTPQKTIVIDQSGFQWQGDLRNTGGLFFYPTASASQAEYTQWQNDMHLAMYGVPRPSSQTKVLDVQWNGVHGRLDLEGVTYGIQKEFLQALDAAVAQGQNLLPTERINFKFLKAGMGFFASGLHFQGTNQQRLEEARLQGILYALRSIREMPPLERAAAIGLVGRIELPFSGTTNIISDIQAAVVALGLEWGGTPTEDAYTPRPGWVNATTNCGDPHAMIGNEGGHQSVDAAMASNAYLDHLNAGFNAQMVLRTSPSLYPTTVALVHPPALVPTAPPVRITPAAAPLATPLPWPPVLTTSATDPLAPPQPWPPVFITPAVATPPWPPAFIPSAAAAPVATPPWPPVFIPPAAAAPVATPPWPPVFIPPAAAAPVATPPWPPAFIPPAAAAPIATPPRPPHHSDAHEPSPQRRPIPPQRAIAIEKRDETVDRLTTLIANIRDKKNNRASWFTLSTDSKVARLQAILDWVHLNEITPSNEIVILALIRDVCAMKRNYLGFYSPHSLTEFNNMVSPAELEHLQQVSSTAKFLVDLGRKPTAIDELIRSGEVQASRMNPL